MRASLVLSGLLIATVSSAQPRATPTQEGSGAGYSTVSARPRVAVTAAPAQPAQPAASATATVSVVSAPTVAATATSGPRGPRDEAATVTITNTQDARGRVVVVQQTTAPQADPDAGVDDPNVPTAGALFGGPVPGPSFAYMGVPVNTRRPPPAPPLASGAVLPGHSLPGSTPAPPVSATPWIPWTTSGFQLGPSGHGTDTSGYGFQMQTGQQANPGTLRNLRTP